MLRSARAGCLLLVITAIGCNGGGASSTSSAGTRPHGGEPVPLPDGGYVEVVKKPGGATFYFYQDNSDTPFSPAPSSGTLTLAQDKKVELKAQGDALTTPPGAALPKNGEIEGVLNVELGGKMQSISLGVR